MRQLSLTGLSAARINTSIYKKGQNDSYLYAVYFLNEHKLFTHNNNILNICSQTRKINDHRVKKKKKGVVNSIKRLISAGSSEKTPLRSLWWFFFDSYLLDYFQGRLNTICNSPKTDVLLSWKHRQDRGPLQQRSSFQLLVLSQWYSLAQTPQHTQLP